MTKQEALKKTVKHMRTHFLLQTMVFMLSSKEDIDAGGMNAKDEEIANELLNDLGLTFEDGEDKANTVTADEYLKMQKSKQEE